MSTIDELNIDPKHFNTVQAMSTAAWELQTWRDIRPPETVEDITSRLNFEVSAARQAHDCALSRLQRHLNNYGGIS